MEVSRDKERIGEILKPHLPAMKGSSWEEVFSDDKNIFLIDGDNLALFEEERPKVYLGHYFFNSARGREAIKLSNKALDYMFSTAEVIQGWTPTENKAACWLSRRLGFTSYGLMETFAGPMELFIMTKNEWSNK